jgi:hypothetical protein
MPANSSYSLPKPQSPTTLPLRSAGEVMPLSLNEICRVPDFWNTWPTSVMFAPCSRDCSALGTHAIAKSAEPPSSTVVCGTVSVPAGTIVTFSPCCS